MNLRGFELRHLAALDMLLTERHVGRAAQRLNLSQPAVSNLLAFLRYHFDDVLLVRVGNTLRLTPFAETLREPVRRLLVDLNSVSSLRPNFVPETATGEIRIVMAEPTAAMLLPSLLGKIARAAPKMAVECIDVDSDINEFKRGEIDLMILPWDILHDDHGREKLFVDRWVCVACNETASWPEALDQEAFYSAAHIVPQGPQPLSAELAELGVVREVAAIVPHALIPDMVVGTPWLATVSLRLLQQRKLAGLRVFDFPFPDDLVIFGQQWHIETDQDPCSIWLREMVRSTVCELNFMPAN